MPSPPEEEPQIPAGPRLQFESQAGGLLLQHAPAQLGNERARLGGVGAAAVDVGDYGAAGLRDAHIAAVFLSIIIVLVIIFISYCIEI